MTSDGVAKATPSPLPEGDQVLADFVLHHVGQPVENDLFGHASDQLMPQLLADTREHSSFDGDEGGTETDILLP